MGVLISKCVSVFPENLENGVSELLPNYTVGNCLEDHFCFIDSSFSLKGSRPRGLLKRGIQNGNIICEIVIVTK